MLPILLILTAAFAVLTWRDLHTGLLLLVAVLPSYLLRTEIFGVPTTLLELLVVTFLVVWILKRGDRQWLCAWRRLPLIPLSLLIAATISVFVAPDIASALGAWKAYFVEPILLFLVIKYELASSPSHLCGLPPTPPSPLFDRELRVERPSGRGGTGCGITVEQIFRSLGVTAIVLSLVAIFQWLTGSGLPIPWDIARRVTSVFDYPNALGLFLGPVVTISLLNLCHPERAKRVEGSRTDHSGSLHFARLWPGFGRDDTTLFWLSVTILSSIAIVLAQSEAAIVSVVATLLIAGFLHQKTRVLSISLIVLTIVATLLFPPLLQKLTLQDYSGGVRLSQWSETIDMLQDRWLLGAGLSGYPTALEPYHKATHLEIFQYPHNIILNIWVELGLLGLLAVALLAWQVIVSSLPSARERRDPSTPRELVARDDTGSYSSSLGMTQMIAFLALLQMTIHGLVDVPYFKNDLAILTWILLAIVFSYARPTTPATKP